MRVFLSSVHVRLVAKSTAPFQTGGGGVAKEGQQGDGRNGFFITTKPEV